ncbi:MAG: Amuc_1100 family pilus-like protein [Verrucomicrobiota bacterium]
MSPVLKENLNLIIAGSISALLVGGSGYYLYQAFDINQAAFKELETVSASLTKIQDVKPTPNEDNLTELHKQREDAKKAFDTLTAEVKALEMPLEEITPPDFQKRLNEKVQALAKLAESNGVQIPQNFYLNFERYSKSVPKPEVTPLLNRQLVVANLLSELLFQTVPSELKAFERQEFDLEKDAATLAKEAAPAPAKEKEGKKKSEDKDKSKDKAEAQKPMLTGQSYKLQFVTRPTNLREFLNLVTAQKSCMLVIRELKVLNEKQKGPAKRNDADPLGAATPATAGAPAVNLAHLGGPAAAEGANSNAPAAADVGQFIVGDEKIEVTLRVELVSFNEEPAKRP